MQSSCRSYNYYMYINVHCAVGSLALCAMYARDDSARLVVNDDDDDDEHQCRNMLDKQQLRDERCDDDAVNRPPARICT